MRPLRKFEEFLEKGVIVRKTPDLLRANSLINESQKRDNFLKEIYDKIGISDKNANYTKNSSLKLWTLVRGYGLEFWYPKNPLVEESVQSNHAL